MVTPEQVREAVEVHLAEHRQMSLRHESGVVSWPVKHERTGDGWTVLVSHHVRRFVGPCLGTELIAVGYVHEFLPSFAPPVEDSMKHPLGQEIIELPDEAAAMGWNRTKRQDKLRFVHPETGWSGLVIEDAFGRVAWQAFGPKGRTLRPRWVPAPSVGKACRDAAAALAEASAPAAVP